MTCIRIPGGVMCVPNAFVPLHEFGAKVWCEMHSYFGPTFYRSEAAITAIRVPSRKTWRAFEAWQKSLRSNAEVSGGL